ncbi:MAG: RHS repeat-associated core domain-containing protein [Planctomycetes bacterium]|nr:RHS repeat-associated core domain-containing protein [Planctomycetota bacterium]
MMNYVANYFDGIGRLTVTANYGVNFNSSFTRPDTYPNGRQIGFGYDYGDDDALSRVTMILESGGGTQDAVYTYLGLGTIVASTSPQPNLTWTLIQGSGVNRYSGLDNFDRVADCLWRQGTSPTTVEDVQYAYNRVGSRTSRIEALASGNSENYSYDHLQRLSSMARGDTGSTIGNVSFAQSWQLDATGNWTDFQQLDVATPAGNLSQQRTSNQVNEIESISQQYGTGYAQPLYDAAGNMTYIPLPNNPGTIWFGLYDAWNRLTGLNSVGGGTYAYDGLNRRIYEHIDSVTRHVYFSTQWQALETRLTATTAAPEQQFVWGLRYIDNLILRDRSVSHTLDERLYAIQDANWNVTAIVDTSGAVKERYRYTPYGSPTFLDASFTPITLGGSYGWNVLYAGYRWDSDGGLYYVRFRYLNSALGCWLTRDPFGYHSGSPNLVEYVYDSPVARTDPFGLQPSFAIVPPMEVTFDPETSYPILLPKVQPTKPPSGRDMLIRKPGNNPFPEKMRTMPGYAPLGDDGLPAMPGCFKDGAKWNDVMANTKAFAELAQYDYQQKGRFAQPGEVGTAGSLGRRPQEERDLRERRPRLLDQLYEETVQAYKDSGLTEEEKCCLKGQQ